MIEAVSKPNGVFFSPAAVDEMVETVEPPNQVVNAEGDMEAKVGRVVASELFEKAAKPDQVVVNKRVAEATWLDQVIAADIETLDLDKFFDQVDAAEGAREAPVDQVITTDVKMTEIKKLFDELKVADADTLDIDKILDQRNVAGEKVEARADGAVTAGDEGEIVGIANRLDQGNVGEGSVRTAADRVATAEPFQEAVLPKQVSSRSFIFHLFEWLSTNFISLLSRVQAIFMNLLGLNQPAPDPAPAAAPTASPAVVPPPSSVKPPPVKVTSLVDFYLNDVPIVDGGLTREAVLSLNDSELERRHNFIQYLFPLTVKGVAEAPPLDRETFEQFRSPEVREKIIDSFLRMLPFFGLKQIDEQVGDRTVFKIIRDETRKKALLAWVDRDHNYKRLSRMLRCMKILVDGEDEDGYAKALHTCLIDIAAEEGKEKIGRDTITYWGQHMETKVGPDLWA